MHCETIFLSAADERPDVIEQCVNEIGDLKGKISEVNEVVYYLIGTFRSGSRGIVKSLDEYLNNFVL